MTVQVLFFIATEPSLDEKGKRSFWTAVDGAIKGVPKSEQLSLPLEANALTWQREEEGCLGLNTKDCSMPLVGTCIMKIVSIY